MIKKDDMSVETLGNESIFQNKSATEPVIRVSIIIPTYRRPVFLRQAIESVLSQTFQEFELIVVDDCSGDTTGEVVKSFKDKRIRLIQHRTNKGGSASRNTGIQNAKGRYIAFLDDDDEWLPEKLKLQVKLLDNSPSEVGVVYTGYNQEVIETGEIISQKWATKTGQLFSALQNKNWVGTTSSVLLRKECFETVGLFDKNLASLQDFDLWIRISRKYEFAAINMPLVVYHVHNKRISTNIKALCQGLELMLKKHGRLNFGYYIYLEIASRSCFQNEIHVSRESYRKAISLNPFGLKAYLGLSISLFGLTCFKICMNLFHFLNPLKPITSKLSLHQNFSWTALGNTVFSGFRWGIVLLLANLGSPVMVGQYALGIAIVEPVFMFGNLNLRAIQATDAKREFSFTDYLSLRFLCIVIAFLAVLGIVLAVGYRWETFLIVVLLAMVKAVESISDVFYGLFQQHEQMNHIAKSMMMKGPLWVVMLGMGVYFGGNLLSGVMGLFFAGLLILLGYDMRMGRLVLKTSSPKPSNVMLKQTMAGAKLWPQLDMKKILKLAWLALPLGFVMMLIGLNNSIPRFLLESNLGEGELGIFAAVASLMMIGNIVVTAMGQTASPRLANYFAKGNLRNFCKLLGKLLFLGMLLGVSGVMVALVGGREILNFLYKPEYANHVDVLIWLMAAAGVYYVGSILGHAITAARYLKSQVPLLVCVVCVTTLACFRFIPSEGLLGAAISVLLGVSFQTSGSLLILFYAIWKSRSPRHQEEGMIH